MSLPILRKRIQTQPTVSAASGTVNTPLPARKPPQGNIQTGAMARIFGGLFGTSQPVSSSASFQVAVEPKGSLYHHHMGDVFTPGTENFVFDAFQETPIYPFWGRSFLRKPNTFLPLPGPQVYIDANITTNGIGGLQAGQFVLQPLEVENEY